MQNENRIEMTKLPLMLLFAFIVSCTSKTTDKEAKIETKKQDTITKNTTSKVTGQNSDSSVIYDTLVFTDNMNGEIFNNKFKSSQPELKFYREFINSKKINELIVLKEKGVKREIKYLGEIKDLNNKTSYHVVTNFRIITGMLSPRGRSDVVFVNEAKNKIIVYNLTMPENLPKYIRNSILFFEYDNTRVGISIFGGLPPLFCLPEIGCN